MAKRVYANESEKDFNAMLNDSRDMPKYRLISDERTIGYYGGNRMFMAPPVFYDKLMRRVPEGRVITSGEIREYFAMISGADFTEPVTAGQFINIAAWASEQRETDKTPYWRTLKANGELNDKYHGGIDAQREKLEAEGHTVISRGRKKVRWYVKDYENVLYDPDSIDDSLMSEAVADWLIDEDEISVKEPGAGMRSPEVRR